MGLKNFGFYYKISNCIHDPKNKCISITMSKQNVRGGKSINTLNRVFSYEDLNIKVDENNLYEIAYKLFKQNCFDGKDIFE